MVLDVFLTEHAPLTERERQLIMEAWIAAFRAFESDRQNAAEDCVESGKEISPPPKPRRYLRVYQT